MDQELAKLFNAIEHNSDIKACVEIVAKNFPAFSENEIILTFPDELIVDILCHDDLVFPESESKITDFFFKMFDKGQDFVHLYYPLIPFDLLSKTECMRLHDKLLSMKCTVEAKQIQRVANIYNKIEYAFNQLSASDNSNVSISEKLSHSSEILEKMTTLLKSTTETLESTTAELKTKTEECVQKDEEITRLKLRLGMKK